MRIPELLPADAAELPADPFADLWDDPQVRRQRDAWLRDLLDEWEPVEDDAAACEPPLDELEAVARSGRRIVAQQWARIAAIVRDAAAEPEPWVGPDPTRDPLWRDPRNRSVAAVRRERADLAVRAAVADVATRLRMSETAVRTRAAHAETLAERCPETWALFQTGEVGEAQALAAAQLAGSLPHDAPAAWAAFDARIAPLAVRMPPAKFRLSARIARERVHPRSLDDRHRRAAEDRGVWSSAELDGMATVSALLPGCDARAATARVDRLARHLAGQPGETRTLAQIRADVFAALLAEGDVGDSDGAGAARQEASAVTRAVTPVVAITVPALTLLGRGDEPAVLEGYGPIDLATARRWAGRASSWIRILTHPVSGVPLALDRTVYRVPKALRRWLGVVEPVCPFPGCTRPAREGHIDHRVEWQHGGATDADNLSPLCAPHHRIKTESRWRFGRDADAGRLEWISPTGAKTGVDPPPF